LIEPAARAPATTPARPNDVIEILYTSGTTGQPKGVMHTSNTLMSSLAAFIERMALSSGDVVLMASPLAHQTGFAYGMMLSIRLGCPLVLMDVWNGERAAEIIAAEGVTFTMASTPFLADLTKVAERNPAATKSLRVFVTAGAPIPSVLVTRARGLLGAQIVSAWGMTENGTVTSTCLQDSTEKAAETDGCPLPGMEVRVVDADGRVLAAGEEGRLQARTPTCFVGYLKRPELNGVDPDGWFETGDIARLAADGYIRITGRAKDVIIRGGENIPVVEIENLLYKHPAIVDVAIVAMPDPRLGERACAFVVARPGSDVSLPALVAFLEEFQVARQYMPERVELMDDLPRTASGKIQKVALREVAQALVVNATPAE
jgi:cyclohexanecarboxylate-CoA ligase